MVSSQSMKSASLFACNVPNAVLIEAKRTEHSKEWGGREANFNRYNRLMNDVSALTRSDVLREAEAFARDGKTGQMLASLRALTLEQFGELFLRQPPGHPDLAAAIPDMTSDEVQIS